MSNPPLEYQPLEAQLQNILTLAINQRIFPGAVVGVVTIDGQRRLVSEGRYRYDEVSLAMSEDAVFDVASLTKTIPTGLIALRLIDRGQLDLDARVREYLPEFKNKYGDQALIKHLLTYTLEYAVASSSLKDLTADEIKQRILTTELVSPPGTRSFFLNATSILLGWVLERVMGVSLKLLAEREVFEPLGLRQSTFSPERLVPESIVPTEIDPWRGREIRGEVHDESAWKLGNTVGSAGLFTTAGDLLTVLEMVIQNGLTASGERFLSAHMIERMSTNQLTEGSDKVGLGWELQQSSWMGELASATTIGKTGFTGCMVAVDTSRGVGVVMLSNAVHPHRPQNRDEINRIRVMIADTIWQRALR